MMRQCTPQNESPKVISFRVSPKLWENKGLSFISLRAAYDPENLHVLQLTTPDYAPAIALSRITHDKPDDIPLAGKRMTIFENENSFHSLDFQADLNIHQLYTTLKESLYGSRWGVRWAPTFLFSEDRAVDILSLHSLEMGTKARFRVSGDAAAVLGLYSTRFTRGTDAHIPLKGGTCVYKFFDPFWREEARYFMRFCDHNKDPMTDYMPVEITQSSIPQTQVSIRVIDLQGEPVSGLKLLVSGIWTQEKDGALLSGAPKTFFTDKDGVATAPLVPGSIVHLTIAQIAWSREYVVPQTEANMVVVAN